MQFRALKNFYDRYQKENALLVQIVFRTGTQLAGTLRIETEDDYFVDTMVPHPTGRGPTSVSHVHFAAEDISIIMTVPDAAVAANEPRISLIQD